MSFECWAWVRPSLMPFRNSWQASNFYSIKAPNFLGPSQKVKLDPTPWPITMQPQTNLINLIYPYKQPRSFWTTNQIYLFKLQQCDLLSYCDHWLTKKVLPATADLAKDFLNQSLKPEVRLFFSMCVCGETQHPLLDFFPWPLLVFFLCNWLGHVRESDKAATKPWSTQL